MSAYPTKSTTANRVAALVVFSKNIKHLNSIDLLLYYGNSVKEQNILRNFIQAEEYIFGYIHDIMQRYIPGCYG